jgi:hypothetical protein
VNRDASDFAEVDGEFPTFDVPDEALERAAVATEAKITTIGVCTHWYHCNWPL